MNMKQKDFTNLESWMNSAKSCGYHITHDKDKNEYIANRSSTDPYRMGVFMCCKMNDDLFNRLQREFGFTGINQPHGWLRTNT